MSKKDISKILTKGTPKQRLLLIAEDIARDKYSYDRILTDQEFNTISDSFKTPAEIKLWNKWKRIDSSVSNSILNLQGLKSEVLMNISNLRGYILVLNTIENAEILVNSVLHEVKDIKERKRISEKGAKGIDLLFSKTTIDPEGYVDIKTDYLKERATWVDENGEEIKRSEAYKHDKKELIKTQSKEYTLLNVMNNVKNQVIKSATQYLSWSKAIEDFMDEEGFNVKTYRDMVKTMDSQVYQAGSPWNKYREDSKTFIHTSPHLRADKIKAKAKYNIAPNIFPIEVDEDIYNWFKENFLSYE